MMIEAARLELDTRPSARNIYGQMQTMIAEEAGTIIPAYISNVDALSSKVKGLEANPLGGMMGYAMAEYLWLEA